MQKSEKTCGFIHEIVLKLRNIKNDDIKIFSHRYTVYSIYNQYCCLISTPIRISIDIADI